MFNLLPLRARKRSIDVAEESANTSSAWRTREDITSDGMAFLALMAGKTALAHTAEAYPHVINSLAPQRYQPGAMVQTLAGLIDATPKCDHLPVEVVLERGRLQELYRSCRSS